MQRLANNEAKIIPDQRKIRVGLKLQAKSPGITVTDRQAIS
jgi:hypothetical protein